MHRTYCFRPWCHLFFPPSHRAKTRLLHHYITQIIILGFRISNSLSFKMDASTTSLSRLLNETISSNQMIVSSAAVDLDRLSSLPSFPFSLLSIVTGDDNQGVRLAAATYLKNFIRRYMEEKSSFAAIHNDFRNQLAHALLQVEPAVLKVLIEAFRIIIAIDFVKENSWPNLIPELKSAIQSSNLISSDANSKWNTTNALTVLQAIVKPFQYFLNPKIPKEPVPLQLELTASEILLPFLTYFHQFVDKSTSVEQDDPNSEVEQIILITCKCMYFTVRSYMPSAICPVLASFCGDLFRILDSLDFTAASPTIRNLLRLKTAKRSLKIFCSLVTRHRKYSDKFMPTIVSSAIRIARMSQNVGTLEYLPEKIVSLAFDVISHVLQTGPGWRLVSPYFSSLMDGAILPALALNQKDMLDWEEDPEEYMRKNLPSELEEISGWTDGLFTARKSAINLLGVIAMSKGPPIASKLSKRKKGNIKRKDHQSSVGELLVIPFLSKFPLPCDGDDTPVKMVENYYGILMAYGGLQDFLNERKPEYTSMLIRNRVLPLFSLRNCSPYLVATANWVLGALAPCLPQDLSAHIYGSLIKALIMPDMKDLNCYSVRASAAGAISELLENEYFPPDWLSLLEVIVNRISDLDENESTLLFQLLTTVVESGSDKIVIHIPVIISKVVSFISENLPPCPEPWPQVVERGISALATIVQIWEGCLQDIDLQETSDHFLSCASSSRIFSSLLQHAWLMQYELMEANTSSSLPASSCLDDLSRLLGFVMRSVRSVNDVVELKLRELLVVWAHMIADWHDWEETEDLAIFDSIHEAVNLHKDYDYTNFFMEKSLSQNYSIIEGISAFVSSGIQAYPSAARRACFCVHELLHVSKFSAEMQAIKQSIVVSLTIAAFSRLKGIQMEHSKSCEIHKPLLLAISSCYISCPDVIEQVLNKEEDNGFMIWACALAEFSVCGSKPCLSLKSEIKLAAIALAKLVEHLLRTQADKDYLHRCSVALLEATINLKKIQEEENNEDDNEEDIDDVEDEDEEQSDYDEDSEDEDLEETEEEFLERYAKAAAEVEGDLVEEGDSENEAHTIDLGTYDEVDVVTDISNLISKHHEVLLKGQSLPPNLVAELLSNFPQYAPIFAAS